MLPLAAVILAAGNSSRMGRPKALLDYRGEPFIERVCGALRAAGASERVVVLGRDAEAITSAWTPSGERIVVNPEPDLGQLSSLRTGLGALGTGSEGFMVCLVDQPEIMPETYRKVMDIWASHRDAIVIPRCRRETGMPEGWKAGTPEDRSPAPAPRLTVYKRGHPIIIPGIYRRLCFEGPLDKGLHWVTHHPSVKIADADVADSGVIRDCDTPEDYESLADGRSR